ncbi:MAG: hypothetical protein IJ454_03005 [Clostridia bacterium]|nr:hypothetical protein [Clostridia bacterium]
MFISKNKDTILFRTPFSEECDLVQKFSGIEEFPTPFNHAVNFTEAGLVFRRKWDTWHIDIPFAISNDEAPPVIINGIWLGANHEFPGAVTLDIPSHGKTAADIGSMWRDTEGTEWVLISAPEDMLTFISENIGESDASYAFKDYIATPLTYMANGANTDDIHAEAESRRGSLKPIIRHTKRRVTALRNGTEIAANRAMECDSARIYEEYEIVNPVSMAEHICSNRPKGGYTSEIHSAVGEAMAKVSRIYHIEGDGTILCEFRINKLMDIELTRCMGAMFQEKLDAYGGGIYRYIPKLKPIDTPQGVFDFSVPVDISMDNYVKDTHATSEYWESPCNPPDRIVDFFYDREGAARLGFACGYLPLYDGVPGLRGGKLKSALHLIRTRKGYPFFMDGADISVAHGMAYRKYFQVSRDGTSVYTIPCDGKTYLYIDLLKNDNLFVPVQGEVTLLEKSDGVAYKLENDGISISGDKGYAVFLAKILKKEYKANNH